MKTLHDNETRLRDAVAGPTIHEIDELIPDLTDVDIHDHIHELRVGDGHPRRAQTRVRWLGRLTAVAAIVVVGGAIILMPETLDVEPERAPATQVVGGPTALDGPGTNSMNIAPAPAQPPKELPGGFSRLLLTEPAAQPAAVAPIVETGIVEVPIDLPSGDVLVVPHGVETVELPSGDQVDMIVPLGPVVELPNGQLLER